MPKQSSPGKSGWIASLLVITFALGLLAISRNLPHPPITNFVAPDYPSRNALATGGKLITTNLSDLPTRNVHAFNAVASGNEIFAVWYGGYKESALDVAIYFSHYDGISFGKPVKILSSRDVEQALGRNNQTLGNPVIWLDDSGRLWLWVVSVALGGWSNSSLLLSFSNDRGKTWSEPRQLYTSPFINFATLTKSNPIELSKGVIGLPVYHELFLNFSELLVFDRQMKLVDKRRIGWGNTSIIQPSILIQDSNNAIALHRSMNKQRPFIHQTLSHDGGNNFVNLKELNLPNPDASIHALELQPDIWLLAYNHRWSDRYSIDLAISRNMGDSWRQLYTIATDKGGRLGYPWLVSTADGTVHLFYTVNRISFAHHRFDLSWVEEVAASLN